MKSLSKKFLISGACLLGSAFMFYMGVVAERRLAANRVHVADPIELESLVNAANRQAAEQDIDTDSLDFPEALRRDDDYANEPLLSNDEEGSDQPSAVGESTSAPTGQDHPIYLQTGAFTTMDRATAWRQSLVEKGFDPRIISPVESHHAGLYRVRLGPFDNIEDASTTTRKLERLNMQYIVVVTRSD